MVCHYTSGPVRLEGVYFLENYIQEQVKQHGIRNYGGVNLKIEDLQKWSDEIFGGQVLSIEQVLERKDSYSEQTDTGYKEQPI